MFSRQTADHLCGIVALWLTNGHEPVDGGNDTRYEFFDGRWEDAAHATLELLDEGYLESTIRFDPDGYGTDFIKSVYPTAKGIWYAIR